MLRLSSLCAPLYAAVLACLLAACSPLYDPMYFHIMPDAGNPIRTVAVLPLVNNTNDVTAPDYVRTELMLRLQAMQYAVLPAPGVDQALRDQMGITLGQQLDLAPVQDIGKSLGVDGLVYGALDDFSTRVFGVLTEKKARVRFVMIRASDGVRIWSSGAGVVGRNRVVGGATGKAALALEIASRAQLARESEEQAKKTTGAAASVGKLPAGLDLVPAPWFTIPTVELRGEHKDTKEGENVATGLAAGLGEQLIERAVGKPLYPEVRLMMNLIVRPDAVAAVEAGVLQQMERQAAGGAATKEQLALEIATKATELNMIHFLRPLPVGPGSPPLAVPTAGGPNRP